MEDDEDDDGGWWEGAWGWWGWRLPMRMKSKLLSSCSSDIWFRHWWDAKSIADGCQDLSWWSCDTHSYSYTSWWLQWWQTYPGDHVIRTRIHTHHDDSHDDTLILVILWYALILVLPWWQTYPGDTVIRTHTHTHHCDSHDDSLILVILWYVLILVLIHIMIPMMTVASMMMTRAMSKELPRAVKTSEIVIYTYSDS